MPDARDPVPMQAVARRDGGIRWLARLRPGDRARYRSIVAALAPVVERSLGAEVVANRAVGRGRLATVRLEAWRHARTTWTRMARSALAANTTRAVILTDVAACYASIEPEVVAHRLRVAGASASTVEELERFLRDVGERGAAGLPVGPLPSALLANLVLSAADERVRSTGLRHIRWVDDVTIFAPGRREAMRGYDAFRRSLDELGLRPNPRKTAFIDDPREVRARLGGVGWSASRASACDDAAP